VLLPAGWQIAAGAAAWCVA